MDAPVPDREWAERRKDDLWDSFGEFPVDERELADPHAVPAEEFAALAGADGDPYLGRGGVRLRRPPETMPTPSGSMPEGAEATEERVLLVRVRSEETWTFPGGGREPDETYPEAARREVREETGIDCRLTGVAKVDHWVATPDGEVPGVGLDSVHVLNAIFEGEYAGGELRPQPEEILGACWFADLPGALHEDVRDVYGDDQT
jgi:8-oxo-dGTP pyrophosphatase MutT (NUDIX family)